MKIKKLLALSAVALIGLTGCSKEVTFAEAVQFVKDTYQSSGYKGTYRYYRKTDKMDGCFDFLKTAFPSTDDSKDNYVLCAVSSGRIEYEFASSFYKFYVDGKKLEIKTNFSNADIKKYISDTGLYVPDDANINGSMSEYYLFDENGIQTKAVKEYDFSMSYTLMEKNVTGNFKLYEEQTFKSSGTKCSCD